MADRAPVLVVDAGGTLITRSRPGLASRVVQAVRRAEGLTAAAEPAVRWAVLTAADAGSCLSALDVRPATRSAVAAVLAEDPGDAIVLPGAEELLRTAVELGWKLMLASNAGPGTPDLPAGLGRYLADVVESRSCGLVKEDPRFWERLIGSGQVEPAMTLVVGDREDADRAAPAAAGLQSRLVADGDRTGLAALTADLRAAGPAPSQAIAVVAGEAEEWAGRTIVAAPHLDPMVARVTRARVRFVAGATSGTSTVVRRRALAPAVVWPADAMPAVAWLVQGRQRSQHTVPRELRSLLEARGLSMDMLPPADRRHALSMIHEARSESAMAERMTDLIRFLDERGGQPS